MSTALFVAVLVAVILAALLIVWSSVRVWFHRRRRVIADRLACEMAAETQIRSPEPGSYRGATVAGYPIVNNDGMIALTRRRLLFQTLTGKMIEVPVTDITGVREADAFKTAVAPGRQHLIIQTSSGEIGFFVGDIAAWIASLTTVAARPLAVGGSTADFFGPGLDVSRIVRTRRRAKTVVAIVFTSIGLVFGLVAGISAAVVAESISGDRYVEGTVIDLSYNGKGYAPVVEFVRPARRSGSPVGWAPIRRRSASENMYGSATTPTIRRTP
jgi:hypothetical protein